MFRKMRRFRQEMTSEECTAILKRNQTGVLAVAGDDNYPYAVPMNYLYANGKIYFHCALSGHKTDAIARNKKVSFCVIDQDDIIPEQFTSHFRSVIAFGTIRVLDDVTEKRQVMEQIAACFSPQEELNDKRAQEVERRFRAVCLWEMEIQHLSGKKSMEQV